MQTETMVALIAGLTALLTSVGVCIRRIHLKHFKMKTCCTDLSIDMGTSPRDSIELQEITILSEDNANNEHKTDANNKSRQT